MILCVGFSGQRAVHEIDVPSVEKAPDRTTLPLTFHENGTVEMCEITRQGDRTVGQHVRPFYYGRVVEGEVAPGVSPIRAVSLRC